MELKQLSDEQLAAFDHEHVRGARWRRLRTEIDRRLPDGPQKVLDVGGGNGLFVDRIITEFPEAQCTIIDSSSMLLDRNSIEPRKKLLCASVEDIDEHLGDQQFDLITINWVLHHLVGESYRETDDGLRATLEALRARLTPDGLLSVFENSFDGYVIDSLPSRSLYHVTSMRSGSPVLQRLGANTAGVGVCFRSDKAWRSMFATAGFKVESAQMLDELQYKWWMRAPLALRPVRVVHYSLSS